MNAKLFGAILRPCQLFKVRANQVSDLYLRLVLFDHLNEIREIILDTPFQIRQ
jgi:hypothetical protein